MLEILENVNLAPWTSWKVGGPAEFFVQPKNYGELCETLRWSHAKGVPYSVLGAGSNVLVNDNGVSGLVIHMKNYCEWGLKEKEGRLVITAEAGLAKSEVLKVFLRYRLAPAVFLAGLPGDLGGGVVMNAGVGHKTVQPTEFCEIIDGFEVLRLNSQGEVEKHFFNHSNLVWNYRHCQGWQPGIISTVQLSWPLEPNDDVLVQVREGNKRRKSTQPLQQPSCGSVFRNPPDQHSGALIEQAGLKGFSLGGAEVSQKHANFIVNTGAATARDIHEVMTHVQKEVKKQFNVELKNEVVYLGWPH